MTERTPEQATGDPSRNPLTSTLPQTPDPASPPQTSVQAPRQPAKEAPSEPVASNTDTAATELLDEPARAARDAAVDERVQAYVDDGNPEAAERVRAELLRDDTAGAPAPTDQ